MTSIKGWLDEVCRASAVKNGGILASLFTPRRFIQIPSSAAAMDFTSVTIAFSGQELQGLTVLSTDVITETVNDCGIDPLLAGSITDFLLSVQSAIDNRWSEAVTKGLHVLDVWINLLRNGNMHQYLVPALSAICDFIVTTATIADEQDLEDEEAVNESLQAVLNGIRKHIGKFRGDESNEAAYMILLSESIRVCLKLRNVQMASAFLKTIPTNQPVSPFAPRGPATRFRYYFGNLLLQQQNFSAAENPLLWAYTYCPAKQTQLKRAILAGLLALRLRIAKAPNAELLNRHR